jgi:hypothetical protein
MRDEANDTPQRAASPGCARVQAEVGGATFEGCRAANAALQTKWPDMPATVDARENPQHG